MVNVKGISVHGRIPCCCHADRKRWSCMQGDGNAFIFRDDPAVFTFSMHGEGNFPVRKQSSDLDIPLPDGTSDDVYLRCATGKC